MACNPYLRIAMALQITPYSLGGINSGSARPPSAICVVPRHRSYTEESDSQGIDLFATGDVTVESLYVAATGSIFD